MLVITGSSKKRKLTCNIEYHVGDITDDNNTQKIEQQLKKMKNDILDLKNNWIY